MFYEPAFFFKKSSKNSESDCLILNLLVRENNSKLKREMNLFEMIMKINWTCQNDR